MSFAALWSQSLLTSALTAGVVVAGPPLVLAAQAAPVLTTLSLALGLTTLALAFVLVQRGPAVAIAAPAGRPIRTLAL